MKTLILIVLGLQLAAGGDYTWYGMPKKLHSDEQINAMATALAGRSIEVPITLFGAPDAELTTVGHHLMVWIGRDPAFGSVCKLNVGVGPDNQITRAWFTGQKGGCLVLARQLP
jgi:hypothetical protein